MSRCFTFPPPGYQKDPTTADNDLLKKEKRKEKKHKKDKKDKEKREGKEKRDKDRSDGKRKDKKDKKDRQRDKKDKENSKEKEKAKSSTSEDKRINEQSGGYNGEKLYHKDEHSGKSSMQFRNGEYKDQLRKNEESRKEKSSSSDDNKTSVQFWGQNGELVVRNRIKAEDTENSKFVQELVRRIRAEEKGTSSQQIGVESRKDSVNKVEVRGVKYEASFGRNTMVQSNTMPPYDKSLDKRILEKEKRQDIEGDDKRGDKRKEKDRNKQKQGKEKDEEREGKKEKKAKEKSEHKKDHIKKSGTNASLNSLSVNPSNNGTQGATSEGNFKKRKDMEANGFPHENEPRPNKMARSTSNIFTENGRKLDFLQDPGISLSNKQGASLNSFKVDSKDRRVNGIIAPQQASLSAKKLPISSANHIVPKLSPTKFPPVIRNHVAPQPLPLPTAKPPPSVPNHIAARPTKPPPSVPNHVAAKPLAVPMTKPPPSVINHIAEQPLAVHTAKPSPLVPNRVAAEPLVVPMAKPPHSVPNHIGSTHPFPISSTKPPSTVTNQNSVPPLLTKPAVVANKVASQPLPNHKKKHFPSNGETPLKPPHPDTKYLNQILTVPKLEQLSEFDDQEWLFGCKDDPFFKKTTMDETLQDKEEVQVWSEAKHIESVGICALPYVIPY